jgi:hypothetical protein
MREAVHLSWPIPCNGYEDDVRKEYEDEVKLYYISKNLAGSDVP